MESKDKTSMMLQKLPSEIAAHGIEQQGHVRGLNDAEDLVIIYRSETSFAWASKGFAHSPTLA